MKFTLACLAFLLSTCWLAGQVKDPAAVAERYLQENLETLQLKPSDIENLKVKDLVISRHNKVTHLYLQQQHADIAVFNAILNMNILEDGRVISYGNRFISDLAKSVNTSTPSLSMEAALRKFIQYFGIAEDASIRISESISATEALFDPSGLALEPIEVKLIYQPVEEGKVRLAWNITLYQLDAQHWWNARIDATNGELLDYYDHVVHCEFGHTSCDGVHTADAHAEPHGQHLLSPVNLNQTDSAKYRAYPLFVESPNHGGRELIVNPAEPISSPYGWHDVDGQEGHEYTITRGNNVHAYHDIFDLNESNGDEPDGGDSLCFDYELDLAVNRPYTHMEPMVTNLFYWNNLMHDIWYHYGFDEMSGNFQETNYTGEGNGGDYVRAEALDGSGTNNANFATPGDGQRPRMQMYIWGGTLPNISAAITFEVTAPDSLAGNYEFQPAGFGGSLPTDDELLTGQIVLADDGEGETADACEPIINSAEIQGNIAMVDRGSCEFGAKCLAAEEAGAIAVIVCNNTDEGIFTMGAGNVGSQVTIPSVMVSQQDCNLLKMGLPGVTIEIGASTLQIPLPGPSGRSSDLDNGVIVHEYTHGISNRLTGGPSSSGCLNNFEQAGEGWSDWFALVMTTTSEMTAEQGRGIGTYASGQPTTGDGIRTHPYSRDMNVNPHTYANINGESVPHGVGSVWCVMIWDLYWNLVDEYGFDDDIYFGTGGNNIAMQLVIDGLKLQPCSPTFIESRDAILEADMINNGGANRCLIWETFARRGLGFSAEPEGEEAFDVSPICQPIYQVFKSGPAEAMAGDILTYELLVSNGRSIDVDEGIIIDELPAGTAYVEGSSNCDITEDNGVLSIDLGQITSNDIINCTYQLVVDDSPASYLVLEDNIDMGFVNWDREALIGDDNWVGSITKTFSEPFSVSAKNIETQSDQVLTLKSTLQLNGQEPVLSFWHLFDTQAEHDGGIVEISTNGTDWTDLGDKMVRNGYNGIISNDVESPIAGRPAFQGNSDDWIQTVIDLSDYSGQEILVRFRFVTDDFQGGDGWYVDNFRFYGNYREVTNIACVEDMGEARCSEVTTIIFGEPVNATNEVLPAEQLNIFPNPNTGRFIVRMESSQPKQAELRILSINGKMLFNQQYDAFLNEEIDLSNYSAGVYLVQLLTANGITTRKVIIE